MSNDPPTNDERPPGTNEPGAPAPASTRRRSRKRTPPKNETAPPELKPEPPAATTPSRRKLFTKGNRASGKENRRSATAKMLDTDPIPQILNTLKRIQTRLERKTIAAAQGNAIVSVLRLKLEVYAQHELQRLLEQYRTEIARLKDRILSMAPEGMPQ